MPSFTPSRTRRKRPTHRHLHVEALERRELLFSPVVGDVTARLVGSTLLLTGDALGNQLMVAAVAGGKVAVLGVNAGTTINGSASTFVTSRPVTSIVAAMRGGDDLIGFGNSAGAFADQLDELGIDPPPFDPGAVQTAINTVAAGATTFTLPGSLTITTADGADKVGILGTIGGSVAANLGSAPTGPDVGNGLFIGYAGLASRVGGVVSIVGGAQWDVAVISATTIGGGVFAALGAVQTAHRNALFVYQSSLASLAYTGGTGGDVVRVEESQVRYGVSVATGAGDDRVGLYQATVGLNAVINTGVGNDEVEVIESQVRYNLFVSLGAGNDRLLIIGTTRIFAAYLFGGPGTNNLAIDEVARPGIRWLYSVQFQSGVD